MEINPYGVILVVILSGVLGIFICMGLMALLQAFKIINFKTGGSFLAWSIGGGIALTIIFWEIKCNTSEGTTSPKDRVDVISDTTHFK